MRPSQAVVYLNVYDLYSCLRQRLEEIMDVDEETEDYVYRFGHTPHTLIEWWIKIAFRDVLSLPVEGIYPRPSGVEFETFIRRGLSCYESWIFGYRPAVCGMEASWTGCDIKLERHRLTIAIH